MSVPKTGSNVDIDENLMLSYGGQIVKNTWVDIKAKFEELYEHYYELTDTINIFDVALEIVREQDFLTENTEIFQAKVTFLKKQLLLCHDHCSPQEAFVSRDRLVFHTIRAKTAFFWGEGISKCFEILKSHF